MEARESASRTSRASSRARERDESGEGKASERCVLARIRNARDGARGTSSRAIATLGTR